MHCLGKVNSSFLVHSRIVEELSRVVRKNVWKKTMKCACVHVGQVTIDERHPRDCYRNVEQVRENTLSRTHRKHSSAVNSISPDNDVLRRLHIASAAGCNGVNNQFNMLIIRDKKKFVI
jgi:hypothetical protein